MTYFICRQSVCYFSSRALVTQCALGLNACVSLLDRVVSIEAGNIPIRIYQISLDDDHRDAADACVPDISG